MTIEFIEQRIREQEEYIKHQENKKKYLHYNTPRLVIPKVCKRIDELIESAQGQLDYFRQLQAIHKVAIEPMGNALKKISKECADSIFYEPRFDHSEDALNYLCPEIHREWLRSAYAQEFEGIMKASTTIIH